MQRPSINYVGMLQKHKMISVWTEEGSEEMFTNPFTTITINNKKTATGTTAPVILLSFVVPASAATAREDRVGGERRRLPSNTDPIQGTPSPAQEQTKLPGATALKAELASTRAECTCCGEGRGNRAELPAGRVRLWRPREEMAVVL